jgi:hypothetical protein
VNRLLEELAGMEQPHRKGLALIERVVRPVGDLDMLLEIDALEHRLGARRLRHIGRCGTLLRLGRQQVEAEGLRLAQLDAGKRRGGVAGPALQASEQRRSQGQGCGSAVDFDRHSS